MPSQLRALYFLYIFALRILNSHSLFNHSRNVASAGAFKHVELRRRYCRRMRVVILHVAPRCLCLTLASCGRRDRTVLHRKWLHRDTVARGMSAKSVVPIQTSSLFRCILSAGCKILMTLLRPCWGPAARKFDGVICGKLRNGEYLAAISINRNVFNYTLIRDNFS